MTEGFLVRLALANVLRLADVLSRMRESFFFLSLWIVVVIFAKTVSK